MNKKELEEYFSNKELLYYKFDKQISEPIVKKIGDEAINSLNKLKSLYVDAFEETSLSEFINTVLEAIALNFSPIKSEARNKAIYAAIKLLKYDERDVEGLTCDSDEFNKIFEVAEKYIRLSLFV